MLVQQLQDSCLVTRGTSGISSRFCRAIRMLLEVMQETQVPFLVATVILGFLSIFNKSQASSPFEALNSACLYRCQRDVSPPVQMRRGLRAQARVYTGDSDIPSFVRLWMSWHSNHCREIQPSFETGHLDVNST